MGCSGLVPEREHQVHLIIGGEDFCLSPTYYEIEGSNEEAKSHAQYRASRLRAALAGIVKDEPVS